MSELNRVLLEMDDDDYEALQEELAERRGRVLPDGERLYEDYSDGEIVGEIVRDLREYREIWEREHPEKPEGGAA